jgi:hypothetical protein
MKMLGGRPGAQSSGGETEYPTAHPAPRATPTPAPAKKAPDFNDMDDDIPF